MARVHLVPIAERSFANGQLHPDTSFRLRESQRLDRFGVHTLTDDPDAADLILFVRPLGEGTVFRYLFRHPLVRRHRSRCFLYDPNDRVVPLLPGVYPSVERAWHHRNRTRSGAYLLAKDNPVLDEDHHGAERTHLYSFLGTYFSAPVRADLGRLDDPRGCCRDTFQEGDRIWRHGTEAEILAFRRRYLETTWASHFVLCPRGYGASSMRLFETMRAGRAPVILADDWVPPEGPCWERFSVRVAEADWRTLPARLAAREADAAAMGRLARQQWEEWYAPPVLFHRTVEDCLSIGRARRLPERVAGWLAALQMLRPSHQRHWARQTGLAQRLKKLVRRSARG
ncbi:MAG: exostosin family protein [Gluconacetobacter diazotrophicus]|nr:exostosin family protein [Gluconacetobacter diazotrophicus]